MQRIYSQSVFRVIMRERMPREIDPSHLIIPRLESISGTRHNRGHAPHRSNFADVSNICRAVRSLT